MATGYYDAETQEWVWESVNWEKNQYGIFESDRVFPSSFFQQEWDNDRQCTAGVILIRKDISGVPSDTWLVECYGSGCFGFPKGRCEKFETPRETAQREFYEETGTTIQIPERCPQIIVEKYVGTKKIVLVFFVVYVSHRFDIHTFPLSDVEITKFGWVNLRQIYQKSIPLRLSSITKNILMSKPL